MHIRLASACVLALALLGCADGPTGLAVAQPANVTVKVDFLHRPLPEMPLPNDLATRYDATSPTLRRVNASLVAPTSFERVTREKIDTLDGWGVYMPISVPFSGPIDVAGVVKAHVGDDFAFPNDVVYVIDIDRSSPHFGKPVALDLGAGNFPIVLKNRDLFDKSASDPRGDSLSVLFDETDEDLNHNGAMDAGEDTDLDGVLDAPNYLPGMAPTATDLVGRADALMSFYERETNTLLVRPLQPLRQRNTYAVVVTRRLEDAKGAPVGSPYRYVHHLGQTDALRPLDEILRTHPAQLGGLDWSGVAFAWTFTTGSMTADLQAVRDGLYGHGTQKQLQGAFPPDLVLRKMATAADQVAPGLYVLKSEIFIVLLKQMGSELLDFKEGSEQWNRMFEQQRYVDFHVFGTFPSPRLLPRQDAAGKWLSYNEMTWPPDLERNVAPATTEQVSFWLTVPRKEVSPRAADKPAGVAIIGHGYMSSRIDAALFGGSMAQHGLAAVAIDNVSHGLPIGPKALAEMAKDYGDLADAVGAGGLFKALADTRAWDQDLDGDPDSGADFWTAYTFHTRDVLRQTAVDYMQLVRILRAFDGQRAWAWDTNGDGQANDLAGDFDGDGHVDIGGPAATLGITGSSLGGIMAAMMAGCEPQIAASVPMCAGGGLGDVGVRSEQGGVREAVLLRIMGPLYIGTPEANGQLALQTVVPRLNRTQTVTLAHMPAPKPGDSVLVRNLDNAEYDCALVRPDGRFRVAVASDVTLPYPQRHRLDFFAGNAFQSGVRDEAKGKACKLKDGVTPVRTVDKFEADVAYHFQSAALDFKKGEALSPLAEGLGLHRARPELRRFMGIAQMVLDPADPAVLASHWSTADLRFATGEVVAPHAIVLTTVGDMAVPVATGAAIARAAGLIDWTTKVAQWGGRTANQVLVDAHVLEGVNVVRRYVNPAGDGVLVDPEDLSASAPLTSGQDWLTPAPYPLGKDGYAVPRLRYGLHNRLIADDGRGGLSGSLFPLVIPAGKHDIDGPGQHTDHQIALCKQLGGDAQACDAKNRKYFDQGALLRHAIGFYLASGGKEFPLHACQSTEDCPASLIPLPPPSR